MAKIDIGTSENDGTGTTLRDAGQILNTTGLRKNTFDATTPPSASDDLTAGYEVGSLWIDTNTAARFMAVEVSEGAAVWAALVQKDDLAAVALSGDYAALSGTPALVPVATTGNYADLANLPELGSAARNDTGDFATAAQGALAESAVQRGDALLHTLTVRSVSTSDTLTPSDRGRGLDVTAAATITIPADRTVDFALGSVVQISRLTGETVAIKADSGVTLNGVSTGSGTIGAQWQGVTLRKVGPDAWIAQGDIEVAQ